MITPPRPGFTGVVWEARDIDRLVGDLGAGPGSAPMAETATTWSRLATSMETVATEYDAILTALQQAWQSETSAAVVDRISSLRTWLAESALMARANGLTAEVQSAATELVRLTMPDPAEIAAIQAVQQSLSQIGAALGAPVQAIADTTDSAAFTAKTTAAQVMRTYETATEPLATPWLHERPPLLTSGTALAAEEAALAAAPQSAPLESMPVLSGGLSTGSTPAVPFTPLPAGVTAAVPAAGSGNAGAAVVDSESGRRAGLGADGVDLIAGDNGIVSVPAVLGGSVAAVAAPRRGDVAGSGSP